MAESGRSQRRVTPVGSSATNVSCEPSGERARGTVSTVSRKVRPGGRGNENRTVRGMAGGEAPGRRRVARAMATASAATAQGTSRLRSVEAGRAAKAAGASGPSSAIAASWSSTSRAACQRRSESLARQVRTSRSSAGGVAGCSEDIAFGSPARIAEARAACVLPVKALWPVAIS